MAHTKPPSEMLRVDADFAKYLRDRATREGLSVVQLTRRLLELVRRKQAAFTP